MTQTPLQRIRHRMAGFAGRLAADQQGNLLMIMGMVAVPILMFSVGFGVDYSHAEKLQTKLDAAADAAALSAVSATAMEQTGLVTCASTNNTTADTTNDTMAIEAVDAFEAQVPGYSGTPVCPTAGTGNTTNSASRTLNIAAPTGSGLRGTITVTATVSSTGQLNNGRNAIVTYQAQANNAFTAVLGAKSLAISGRSTATADAAPYINFFLMLDNSPSMLLPSTSTGLSNIRSAFSTTVNTPYGCDFACHEQTPHNDGIHVYNTAGYEVFLNTNAYTTSDVTGNQSYMLASMTNGGNVYDTNSTQISGYIYCNGSGQDAIYQTSNCSNAVNSGNRNANQVAGYWADGYWLTHNYTTLHPTSSNIDLRIDDEIGAAQALIPFAYTTAQKNQVTYAMQMFAFNWTHPGSTTGPVTALAPLNSMTTLTATNNTTLTVPTLGDSAHQDYWIGNNSPPNGGTVGDAATDFTDMFSYINGVMPTPGDGSSSSSPQEVLFIITDGMTDEAPSGSRSFGPLTSTTDTGWCNSIKARGIKIAILYTQYLPDALTGDSWSQSNVAGYLTPNDQVSAALQSCASPGSDGAPLFYQVTTGDSITNALSALFALAVQSAHLVK